MAKRRMQTPGLWERGLRITEVSVNRKLTENHFSKALVIQMHVIFLLPDHLT